MHERAVDATSPPPTASHSASGSSFYTAMRILPAAQRDAMFEIYRFCRAVDDIADSSGPRPARIAQLAEWRDEINDLYQGKVGSKVVGLADPVRNFGLRRDDFLTVIDGMEMDAREDIRAPSFATLDLYCDRVASAVGRLSVRVFGMAENDGIALAHHLGRALQLTNILRDIDEDAAIGRLYLPREALRAANILTLDPAVVLAHPRLAQACEPVVARAREHFAEADRVMAKCARRTVRAPRIMSAAYKAILRELTARGFDAPRRPVKVSKPRLLLTILRYAII